MSADVDKVLISVPGEPGELALHHPEWTELASGWQLGGWVNRDEGYQFTPMFGADRITVTYPSGLPEFVTLRGAVQLGTSRGLPHVYLKIPAARPPQSHPVTAPVTDDDPVHCGGCHRCDGRPRTYVCTGMDCGCSVH